MFCWGKIPSGRPELDPVYSIIITPNKIDDIINSMIAIMQHHHDVVQLYDTEYIHHCAQHNEVLIQRTISEVQRFLEYLPVSSSKFCDATSLQTMNAGSLTTCM